MNKTLIGRNSFTSKQGKQLYLLHFTQPFSSCANADGLSCITEFVNFDIYEKAKNLIGLDVVIDYEKIGSYFKAISIRKDNKLLEKEVK